MTWGSGLTEAHERTGRRATVWWEMALVVAAVVVEHMYLWCRWYIHSMRGPSRMFSEMRHLRDLGWEA